MDLCFGVRRVAMAQWTLLCALAALAALALASADPAKEAGKAADGTPAAQARDLDQGEDDAETAEYREFQQVGCVGYGAGCLPACHFWFHSTRPCVVCCVAGLPASGVVIPTPFRSR